MIVCCWVVVVSASLAPAEQEVVRAQHTSSKLAAGDYCESQAARDLIVS